MKENISRALASFLAVFLTSGSWPAAAQTVVQVRIAAPSASGAALSYGGQAPVRNSIPYGGLAPVRNAIGLNSALPSQSAPTIAPLGTAAIPSAIRYGGQAPLSAAPAGSARALPAIRPVSPAAASRSLPASKKLGVFKGIDFKAFSPANLGKTPAAGARAAGSWLMDRILGVPTVERAPAAVRGGERRGRSAARLKKPYDPLNRPFSPYRLKMYEMDPENYARTFLFGEQESAPEALQLLTGLAVHEALEAVYKKIAAGTPGTEITLSEILAEYDKAWAREKKAGDYKAKDGWTEEDFHRRGKAFIERRFEMLAPFDGQEKVLSLEETVLWTMTDPATGKAYEFKGKIDRLMVDGDTVYIRDWKTHFSPPSLRQLEIDDYQLGLYALALRKVRPDLVKGKKIKLAWDFKEFTQEIEVTDEYLARIEERVFGILRSIETFKERVESERDEWKKRISPDKRPAGLAKIKKSVDRIGAIEDELAEKKKAAGKLKREYGKIEEGIERYAREQGKEAVAGKKFTAAVERSAGKGVPTKSDDPEGHEAVAALLKKGGVWKKYSSLDPSAVKRMAEFQGGADHAAYLAIQGDIGSAHEHSLAVEAKEPAALRGGVARPKLPRNKEWAPDAEPGLYSATQLATFLKGRDEYAKRYLLRVRNPGPKGMGLLAGSAIHETMERLYVWLLGGKQVDELTLDDLLGVFEERWAALSEEGDFTPDDGLTESDYKRGSKEYIKAKWDQFHPFEGQGRIIYLEKRMHFTLTDPKTGKTYKFQGTPDRVMLDGGVIVIRDWKSHHKPPSDEEVFEKDYQLGIYLLAMKQLFPDLMKGGKARLIWDFKNKATTIEVDEAYLAGLEVRLFGILAEMDALRRDVEKNRAAWEDRLRPVDVPKSAAEAAKRVDRMGALAAEIKFLDERMKALKDEAAGLEEETVAFQRRTGRVEIEGTTHTARLVKKGAFAVPTKTREKEAYARVVAALKGAGVWDKYSKLDYAALKKAMADPKSPDKAVFKKIEPLLREFETVKVKLSEK